MEEDVGGRHCPRAFRPDDPVQDFGGEAVGVEVEYLDDWRPLDFHVVMWDGWAQCGEEPVPWGDSCVGDEVVGVALFDNHSGQVGGDLDEELVLVDKSDIVTCGAVGFALARAGGGEAVHDHQEVVLADGDRDEEWAEDRGLVVDVESEAVGVVLLGEAGDESRGELVAAPVEVVAHGGSEEGIGHVPGGLDGRLVGVGLEVGRDLVVSHD